MTERLNYFATSPKAMDILLKQESYLGEQFEGNMFLLELVKLRVSQINQCAYCIDMHSKDALKIGEKAERIIGLSAWREMPFYTAMEQCALQWAELSTLGKTVSDADFKHALDTLGKQVLVDLTIAINAINSWNRIARCFKPDVGSYEAS